MMLPSQIAADQLMLHSAFVRSVARAVLKGNDLVDDVEQDTYAAALERGASRTGSLRPWLAGIARRKALLRIRSRSNARRREQRAMRTEQVDSTVDAVARAESARRVCDAVLRLDEPYRTALVLRFYDDLPPREIAIRLGIPVETVRTRIKRGVAQLRGVLEEKEGRDWRAALLPLAAAGRTGAVASGVGMLMMKKAAGVLVAVLLLGGAAWWMLRSIEEAPAVPRRTSGTQATTEPDSADAPGLAAAPLIEAQIDRALDLHGVVVDSDGVPIANATLATFTMPWGRTRLVTGLERAYEEVSGPRTHSNREGRFALRLQEHARCHVRVAAPGFATHTFVWRRAGEHMRIVLTKAVELTLRLQTEDGTPAPDTLIGLMRFPARGDLYLYAEATTNAEGVAVFPGLPGATELAPMVRQGGWSLTTQRPIPLPPSGPASQTLLVTPCEVVTGTVRNTEGDVIAGARVGLDWVFSGSVRTREDGTFSQPGGKAGRQSALHIVAPGYARAVHPVSKLDSNDIVLRQAATITGRVTGPDGDPLEDVLVSACRLSDRGGPMSNGEAKTSKAGTFTITGLGAGFLHVLVLQHSGYGRLVREIFPPAAGASLDVGAMSLTRGCAIVGTITDDRSEPITRAMVRLNGPTANPDSTLGRRERGFTDDLGRFSFADLSPGTYVVSNDNNAQTHSVVLTHPGRTARITFGVSSVTTRTVRVVDEHGLALPNARVTFNGTRRTLGTVKTNDDGIATIDKRGDVSNVFVYALTTEDGAYFGKQALWTAGAHGIDVTLSRAALVTGSLIMPSEVDAGGVYVTARSASDKYLAAARADKDGRFEIKLKQDAGALSLVVNGQVQRLIPDSLMERMPIAGRVDGVTPGARNVSIRIRSIATDRSVTFRVRDEQARPIANARISTGNDLLGTTDANGHYEAAGLAARETLFSIDPPMNSRGLGAGNAKLFPNGQTVDIMLDVTVWIKGIVYMPDGQPATAGVFLETDIKNWAGAHLTRSKSGAFNLFVPKRALPVTITGSLGPKDSWTHRGSLEVSAAPEGNVRLELALVK